MRRPGLGFLGDQGDGTALDVLHRPADQLVIATTCRGTPGAPPEARAQVDCLEGDSSLGGR
jgi:hypothetical protein